MTVSVAGVNFQNEGILTVIICICKNASLYGAQKPSVISETLHMSGRLCFFALEFHSNILISHRQIGTTQVLEIS